MNATSKALRRGPDTVEILQLRIDLEYILPTVTRTLLIRASSSLGTLHTAIQAAMGWEDSHLHEFEKDGVRYGQPNLYEDFEELAVESERKQLGTLFRKGTQSLSYLYDFGDSWKHTVTLEDRLPADLKMQWPRCIAGENSCPPEDVGGPPGYMHYLEAVLDPNHEEHVDMIQWRGAGFHPSHFSPDEANARLKKWLFRKGG